MGSPYLAAATAEVAASVRWVDGRCRCLETGFGWGLALTRSKRQDKPQPTPTNATKPTQVEVKKIQHAAAGAAPGSQATPGPGAVVRACIARLPPGYERIEIESLQDDQIWGLDGFDT